MAYYACFTSMYCILIIWYNIFNYFKQLKSINYFSQHTIKKDSLTYCLHVILLFFDKGCRSVAVSVWWAHASFPVCALYCCSLQGTRWIIRVQF